MDKREKTKRKKGIGREGCSKLVKEGVNRWGVLKYVLGGNEMSSRRGLCSRTQLLNLIFLQRKCGHYEIMQACAFCTEIGNLCGESVAYLKKMRPPHKYADFGWLCIVLRDCIIAFFWRDWLGVFNTSQRHYCHILMFCSLSKWSVAKIYTNTG